MFWLKRDLCWTLTKRARGDYSPDPKLATLPSWERPTEQVKPAAADKAVTIDTLLDQWQAETKPAAKTRYGWGKILGKLTAHLGHHDVTRITQDDIIGWKSALVTSGLAQKTISNHLTIASTIFGWAAKNRLLASNPAQGVTLKVKKDPATRKLPYSDDDAATILKASRNQKGARRWVPWLLAYSGARIQEVCQTSASDVRQEGGTWYLDINADGPGKSVKNIGSARKVPLHPAVIQEGFLKYVERLPKDGSLFPDLKPDRFGMRGGTGVKVLGRWVRVNVGMTDARKQPNHAWRHRFKDACRNAHIPKDVHDRLTGHKSGEEGDDYGHGHSVKALAEELVKLPAVTV